MKKYILAIAAIAATSLASFADTTLAEAYNALAALSGMSQQNVGTAPIDSKQSIKNYKVASVNVAPEEVQKYRDQFVWMTENLPVRNMVIGANNQRELAMVYSTPAGNGLYNILVLEGNAVDGQFAAAYGQTTKAGIEAIKGAKVQMDAYSLTMVTSPENGSATLVSMAE